MTKDLEQKYYNLQETMSEELKGIREDISDLRVLMAEMPDKLLERADCRYASKTFEKLVYALVVAFIVGILTIVFDEVLRH